MKSNWIAGTITAALLAFAAHPSFAQSTAPGKADAKKADPAMTAFRGALSVIFFTSSFIAGTSRAEPFVKSRKAVAAADSAEK